MGGYLLSVEIENNESFGIFNLEDFKLSPAHTDTNHPQGLFSSIDSLAESYHHIHHTHLSISLDYDGYSLHDPYHGSIDGKSAFFSKVESSNIAKFKEIFRI